MTETVNSARATARFVRVSPMKARRVIDLVRGKSVEDALAILKYAPQAASEDVAKVVASAAANAENNFGLDPRTLVISEAYADEGPTMRSEEHTSELQSRFDLVCRLLLEKKKKDKDNVTIRQ